MDTEPGRKTASDRQEEELNKPPKERDPKVMKNLGEAVRTVNVENAITRKMHQESGLPSSGWEMEPLVDENGNLVGYTGKGPKR